MFIGQLNYDGAWMTNFDNHENNVLRMKIFYSNLFSQNKLFGGGVSNRWTGIWNGTVEWKMEWNSDHTQL